MHYLNGHFFYRIAPHYHYLPLFIMPTVKLRIAISLFICLFLLSGCQWVKKNNYDNHYGSTNIINRESTDDNTTNYLAARDVLDKRCVVCHACYDAPCQLKLNSLEGIDRGASKRKVYDKRVFAADPSHLFDDGINTAQWREKEFYPVLNERSQTPEANLQLSLLYRLLEQKRTNPLKPGHSLPESIDTSLKRKQSCPKIEEYDKYAKKFPLQGMPFGLPGISDTEHNIIKQWISNGATAPKKNPLTAVELAQIKRWEDFFNLPSLQNQLVSRYIFEHLFLASLYFQDEKSNTSFYKLVRSYTPSGQAIRVIASRRPFDSPTTDTFYYRLRKVESSTVVKTLMPYALDQSRFDFFQEIFFSEDFNIKKLPSYESQVSTNPFVAFADIPIYARYKFLLEEAQFTIMNFIKGPVCRGQLALDVINDDFWIVFNNPEVHKKKLHDPFYRDNAELLRFPAHWGSQGSLFSWFDLAKRSTGFIQARSDYLKKITPMLNDSIEQLIWDGYKRKNPNASLTIFRHFDSATVVQGFAGTTPKTSWLIGYGLLERIHYLLVAGFDVNGTIQHQLVTRLYMEFLRMEGEAAFISLLPKQEQAKTVRDWNTDPGDTVEEYFHGLMDDGKGFTLDIDYNDQESHLSTLRHRIAKHVNSNNHPLQATQLSKTEIHSLEKINAIIGTTASYFPETAFIRVRSADSSREQWFTILRHSSHRNLTHLLSEENTRTPKNDRLNILPNFFTSYPNRFIDITVPQIESFVEGLAKADNQEAMDAAIKTYAISRTSLKFWAFSDDLIEKSKAEDGLDYGLFDYNRLEKH